MGNQFIKIPNWLSKDNQGGGITVAELSSGGHKDLIVFQIANPPQLNQGLYKIGRNINADGIVTDGWTDWQQVPDWRSWENQGGAIAVADLAGNGKQDLIVFQIDNPPQLNQGLYKIGRNINADGVVADGWTDWQQVPDWRSWENQGGAIAVADLASNGKQDLIVFQIDNPPQLNRGLYKIGRDLNTDGIVTGGWSDWIEIPDWFSWENQGAGVAIVDLDNNGQKDIIVFQIDAPPQQNQAFFKIGKNIRADGQVVGGWSPWYGVPSCFSFENQGGGIAIADLTGKGSHEMVVLMVDHPTDQNAGFYQVLPLDNDPKTQGTWELLPYHSQVLPVHAALLPGGKVLFAAGSGNNGVRFNSPQFGDITKNIWCSVVWDYAGSTPDQPKFFHPDTLRNRQGKVLDFFCGGEAFLADGKLLTAGGTLTYDVDANGNPNGQFTGRVESLAFDPTTQQWIRQADMADGRWYPTLVTLGDGRVLIAAGLRKDGQPNRSLEVFTPDGGLGSWKQLPLPPVNEFSQLPLYAHLFLTENGLIFFSGGRMDDADISLPPCLIDITQNPITKRPVGGLDVVDSRNQSTSVLLPPAQDQRVMIMGGAPPAGEANATDSVDIINLKDPTPTYNPGSRLLLPRVHLNAVLLPDRTVFVSGGALQREGGSPDKRRITARYQSEIYDPLNNTWRLGATAKVARMYHSVALLLPDGRVVAASGNPDKGRQVAWEPPDPNEELRLEIYSPPYLFQTSRPVINTAPTEWKYGQTINIESPQAGSIRWVSLIKNGVTTHSFNTGQQLVDLNIVAQAEGKIQVTVTSNPNLAPPGWYMLFITDNNRIPSVATWIRLTK